MADAEVEPATPEEYRKMLDEIGLYTRAVENGIDAVWWKGRLSIRLQFHRARNGWWDMHTVDPWGNAKTLLWSSAYASNDTREFIENWLRSRR